MKAQKDEWEATKAVPTQDELRASCFARLGELDALLDAHRALLSAHSVPHLACYEAGQSLIAGSYPWRAAALAAQRAEWMGDLYRRIRKSAFAADVDLLNWYSAATNQEPTDTRVDVFGLLEGLNRPLLPKALGAMGR
jgi:hypothetical protein